MRNRTRMKKIGNLESLELNSVFHNEATEFTPWLAEEANLSLLSDAIGIELSKDFYDKGLERFSLWEEGTLETDDSPQKMIERFNEQLAIGKESKENAEKAKEERKILTQKKKDIRAEIKELEAQLKALGVKAKEIKETKENALRLFDE